MGSKGSRPLEPFFELSHFQLHVPSIRLLNQRFCRQNYVVVLGEVDLSSASAVNVGMLDTEEEDLLRVVEQSLGRKISPVRINAAEITRALNLGFEATTVAEEDDHFKLSLRPVQKVSFDPDNSVDQILKETLGRAITLGASDVHIEAYENDIDVRYRVDGILHQMATPISTDNAAHLVSRLKVLSNLDISERRRAQDGRVFASFDIEGKKRPIDFRLSILPGHFGEDVVLRILDSSKPLVGLEKLGFASDVRQTFQELIENPEGMLLVTGPTGSGKTTTLYSALDLINTDRNKVLTVEDPIEYVFDKTNQKQVSSQMSFADYARAFMRQDPDIMMIGEIRDEETADTAIRAAQTGHLVLSTLHANDSISTVSRLMTLQISRNMIADTVLGVLSQRLVRKICSNCKEVVTPDDFANALFEKMGSSFELHRGAGCEKCLETGYKGRLGLFELFAMTPGISHMIVDGVPAHALREQARADGMRTLFGDGLGKVRVGVTTFEELRRVVPYRIIQEVLGS